MKVRPIQDKVVIRPVAEINSSVLVIPDNAQEKPQQGEVVAIGLGSFNYRGERLELDVSAGDKVLFGKYSGSEIKLNGETLLILRQEEILAILESEEV